MAFKNTTVEAIEPVKVRSDDLHGDRYKHPAFAQIAVSRVSGHTSLYDSDFDHNHFMVVRIYKSELTRNLSVDWHHASQEYIEVAMSESQWATFVSSPNAGSGVPCTLSHLMGERMPGIVNQDRVPQFQAEMAERSEVALKALADLEDAIAALGLSGKKTADLTSRLNMAKMQVASNMPFVEKQFDEHMEKTIEKAKAEIHGYMTNVIHRAGLTALTGGTLPLSIEDKTA